MVTRREKMSNEPTITNNQLSVSIARIEERLAALGSDVHRIEESLETFLNGSNGRPGVIERLTINEQALVGLTARVTSMEAQEKESAKLPTKVIVGLIGIITTLSGSIVLVVQHFLGATGGTPPGH